MDSFEDRTTIADAMGHKHTPIPFLPNPYQNPGDCEALIQLMNGPNFNARIEITYSRYNATVTFRWVDDEGFCTSEDWRGEDWKHGVCELALRRIRANEKDN